MDAPPRAVGMVANWSGLQAALARGLGGRRGFDRLVLAGHRGVQRLAQKLLRQRQDRIAHARPGRAASGGPSIETHLGSSLPSKP